jgi:hypothetical protein
MQLTREDLLGRASCFCNIVSVCASVVYVRRTYFIRVVMCVSRVKLCYLPHSAYAKPRWTAEGTMGELNPLLWPPPCLPEFNCGTDLGTPCS